jgi:hypothetical protein
MSEEKELQSCEIDTADPANHVKKILHHMNAINPEGGSLVLASYGQNPETRDPITPFIMNISGGDAESDTEKFCSHVLNTPDSNGYLGLYITKVRGRGCKEDVVAVIGVTADLDSLPPEKRWEDVIPPGIEPSFVLETSQGRFQVTYLFDRLVFPEQAQRLATGLKEFCHADHCTADIVHVWRIPGLPNRPNAKKALEGRKEEISKLIQDDYIPINPDDLGKSVEDAYEASKRPAIKRLTDKEFDWDGDIPAAVKDLFNQNPPVGERSEAEWRAIKECILLGMSDEDIISVFESEPIGERWREERGQNEEWLLRQIEKARTQSVTFDDAIVFITASKERNPLGVSDKDYDAIIKLVATLRLSDLQVARIIEAIKSALRQKGLRTDSIRRRINETRDERMREWREKRQSEITNRTLSAVPDPHPTTKKQILQRHIFNTQSGKWFDMLSDNEITSQSIVTRYGSVLGNAGIVALRNDINFLAVDGVACYPGNPRPIIIAGNGCVALNIWKPGNISLWPDPVTINDVAPWWNHRLHLMGEDARHFIFWEAFNLQHPDKKIGHQCLVYGEHEIGKDSTVRPIVDYFSGPNGKYSPLVEFNQTQGRFQDFYVGRRMIVIEEIQEFGGAADFENQYKTAFTNTTPYLSIEPNGLPLVTIPNTMNFILFTNYQDSVHKSRGNDRLFCVKCPAKTDDPESKRLLKELWDFYKKHDGMRKVLRYLQDVDISAFDHTARAPKTAYALELEQSSRSELVKVIEAGIDEKAYPFLCPDITRVANITDWLRGGGGYARRYDGKISDRSVSIALKELGWEARQVQKSGKPKLRAWVKTGSHWSTCPDAEVFNVLKAA